MMAFTDDSTEGFRGPQDNGPTHRFPRLIDGEKTQRIRYPKRRLRSVPEPTVDLNAYRTRRVVQPRIYDAAVASSEAGRELRADKVVAAMLVVLDLVLLGIFVIKGTWHGPHMALLAIAGALFLLGLVASWRRPIRRRREGIRKAIAVTCMGLGFAVFIVGVLMGVWAWLQSILSGMGLV